MQIKNSTINKNIAFNGIYKILANENEFRFFSKNILPELLSKNPNNAVAITGNPIFRETFKDTLEMASKQSGYGKEWVLNNAALHGGNIGAEHQPIWIFTGDSLNIIEKYINKRFSDFKKSVKLERTKILADFKMPDGIRDFVAVVRALKKEEPKFEAFAEKSGLKNINLEDALLIKD